MPVRTFTLAELATRSGGSVSRDPDTVIDRVATLRDAGPGAIGFLANPRYRDDLASSKASAFIVAREHVGLSPGPCLIHPNPYACFARVAQWLDGTTPPEPGVHMGAFVAESVVLGAQVSIGAGAVIGAGVSIGANSIIYPNVTIYPGVAIGKDAIIHSGAVIGGDGFGFALDQGVWVKIPQTGTVRIGDAVEIGSGTTIDRGALGDTVIEDGVKLDNQIQIGHNVHIGAHTAMAGCVGVAGSATIGRHCTVGGGAIVLGHISLADHVHITAGSLVTKSIDEPGLYGASLPARPNREWLRNAAHLRDLHDMERRLRRLEDALQNEGKQS